MLLAIDPGRDTGFAWFTGPTLELAQCGVGDPRAENLTASKVILERPQYYPGNGKGDPNDLITLAIQVGEYLEFYSRRGAAVYMVLPRVWKGQVPKQIHHARLFSALSPREQNIVSICGAAVPASKRHNMMDAVGLGLWKLDRVKCGAASQRDVWPARPS